MAETTKLIAKIFDILSKYVTDFQQRLLKSWATTLAAYTIVTDLME